MTQLFAPGALVILSMLLTSPDTGHHIPPAVPGAAAVTADAVAIGGAAPLVWVARDAWFPGGEPAITGSSNTSGSSGASGSSGTSGSSGPGSAGTSGSSGSSSGSASSSGPGPQPTCGSSGAEGSSSGSQGSSGSSGSGASAGTSGSSASSSHAGSASGPTPAPGPCTCTGPEAASVNLGGSCNGADSPLFTIDPPVLGTTVEFHLSSNLPGDTFFFIMMSFGQPTPVPLPGTSCVAYVDVLNPANLFTLITSSADSGGDFGLALDLPPIWALAGIEFTFQGYMCVFDGPSTGDYPSNAVWVRLGCPPAGPVGGGGGSSGASSSSGPSGSAGSSGSSGPGSSTGTSGTSGSGS